MEQSKNNGNKTKVTPTDLFTGKTLGNFRIVEKIGHGGMGLVYKAYDRTLDRIVALKILPPHLQDDEFTKRFVREARTSAKLDHPNVVQIYSVGRSQDTWYIAMQHVKGKTLADYLTQGYRFSFKQTLIITRAVANALGAAHRLGIIHRDIKPSNIMIDEQGRVKVMDFGLARLMMSKDKLTQAGTYLGTPEYSSPEQCESGQVDGRSDIYSLGVVLYELLSGRVPHVAETPLALFNKIASETPIPLKDINRSVPSSVERLVEKMMAKKKEDRLQNARETVRAIDRLLHTERLPAQVIDKPARVVIDEKMTPVKPRLINSFKKTASPLVISAVVGAGLILIGFIMLVIHLTNGPPETIAPIPSPEETTMIAPPITIEKATLIVFDFINRTDNQDAQWLGIALADMLIASLDQKQGIQAIPRYDLLAKMKQLGHKITLGSEDDTRVILTPKSNSLINSFETNLVMRGSFYIAEGNKIRIITDLYRYSDKADEPLQHINTTMVQGTDYNQELFSLVDQISAKILTSLDNKANEYGLIISGLTPSEPKENMKNLVVQLITNTLAEQVPPETRTRDTITAGRRGWVGKAGLVENENADNVEQSLAQEELPKDTPKFAGEKMQKEIKTPASAKPTPMKEGKKTQERLYARTNQLDRANEQITPPLTANLQALIYLQQNKEMNSLVQDLKNQQTLALAHDKKNKELKKKDTGDWQNRAQEGLRKIKEKDLSHDLAKKTDSPAESGALHLGLDKDITETAKTMTILLDSEKMEIDEITMNQLLQKIYRAILEQEKEEFKTVK